MNLSLPQPRRLVFERGNSPKSIFVNLNKKPTLFETILYICILKLLFHKDTLVGQHVKIVSASLLQTKKVKLSTSLIFLRVLLVENLCRRLY